MQPIWQVPWVDRLRDRYGVLEGNACCAVEQFLCHSDEDCVCLHIQTHAEYQPATQTVPLSLRLQSLPLSLILLSTTVILVFFFFLLLFVFPLLSLLLHQLPFSPSLFIALPVSLYLCVFRQSDTGAQRFGPTHHCDSHNRLTKENKFHSKSRILMDWAVFFLLFSFFLFSFSFFS